MIIGREKEIATLQGLLTSEESQFVAVYGRRRVEQTDSAHPWRSR